MGDYIKKIRTKDGDKQIDYEALANLPPEEKDGITLVDTITGEKYIVYVSNGKLTMKLESEVE